MPRRALSATRAADVLNLLAAHPDESFSHSQIAQRLGPYQLGEESRAPLQISTLTAPVFDAGGQVDLSLTLLDFRDDPTPSGLRTLGQSLLATADSIAHGRTAASGER